MEQDNIADVDKSWKKTGPYFNGNEKNLKVLRGEKNINGIRVSKGHLSATWKIEYSQLRYPGALHFGFSPVYFFCLKSKVEACILGSI